MAGVGGL